MTCLQMAAGVVKTQTNTWSVSRAAKTMMATRRGCDIDGVPFDAVIALSAEHEQIRATEA